LAGALAVRGPAVDPTGVTSGPIGLRIPVRARAAHSVASAAARHAVDRANIIAQVGGRTPKTATSCWMARALRLSAGGVKAMELNGSRTARRSR
jgi:hypothetical protein